MQFSSTFADFTIAFLLFACSQSIEKVVELAEKV